MSRRSIAPSWLALFLAGIALSCAPAAHARPAYKKALADHFGQFLGRKLNDCRTCHLPDVPGADPDAKPHNAFGARLKAIKDELRKAGKPTDILARLEAVADEDSDGDGVPNLLELLTGHYPGDPADKPTAEELTAGRKALARYLKERGAYPWRPYETVRKPSPPVVKNAGWVRNPIDAFVAAEHEAHGLTPRPEADRAVLLRRVHLDLTGLPPTPAELHAFLEDSSTDAYEKVVDRLLASPRYGERWARHWMDVWRYSDWAGFGPEVRDSQPHVWRWRDWIVESLNADKGYDRMALEMLAGDELAPNDPAVVRATGYLVRNYKRYSREKWLQDTVDHTFQAFLATTVGCARCHDHMYDPIAQKEYYRLRAVFEPHQVRLDRVPGQPDTAKDGLARAYDADPEAKTFLLVRGDDRNPDKTAPLEAGTPEALGGQFPSIQAVKLPREVCQPDKRAFVEQETLAASAAQIKQAAVALEASVHAAARTVAHAALGSPLSAAAFLTTSEPRFNAISLARLDGPLAGARHKALELVLRVEHLEDAGKKDMPEWTLAATETTAAQRQLDLLQAGRNLVAAQYAVRTAAPAARLQADKAAQDAANAFPEAAARVASPADTNYQKRAVTTYPPASTGRRLAFARWLTDRRNPLTARVAMNHIWLRHFGQAIVPSVFDFGRNGRAPANPALLDWLAAEFMERGWSMKAMHRLIVTSHAYRMASTPDAADLERDRDNIYLWRMPPRPVEGEVVRDCVFFVAGKLDLTMGGPDLDQNQGLAVPRRSLYFRHAAEKEMEFLKIFDGPDVVECYERRHSVMPQQALALNNSELTQKHARLLARELSAALVGSGDRAFTVAAFERVLARPPTDAEAGECVAFLQAQGQRLVTEKREAGAGPDPEATRPASDPTVRARESLIHVLLNHHDFVTVR